LARYADGEDIRTLSELVRVGHDGEIEKFVMLPKMGVTETNFGASDDPLDGAFGPSTAAPKPFPKSPLRSASKVRSLTTHDLYPEYPCCIDPDDPFAPPGTMREIPPKRRPTSDDDPFGDAFDPLDESFAAPEENTLAGWAGIIMRKRELRAEDDDPFGVFEAEDDNLEGAFG
jgi:hypothetical protein